MVLGDVILTGEKVIHEEVVRSFRRNVGCLIQLIWDFEILQLRVIMFCVHGQEVGNFIAIKLPSSKYSLIKAVWIGGLSKGLGYFSFNIKLDTLLLLHVFHGEHLLPIVWSAELAVDKEVLAFEGIDNVASGWSGPFANLIEHFVLSVLYINDFDILEDLHLGLTGCENTPTWKKERGISLVCTLFLNKGSTRLSSGSIHI